jgi:osmotically-inducible protein OsmY
MTRAQRRPDAELKAAVVDELQWTPGVDSTYIGVSVTDGAVTLSGEVESYPEKSLAEKAVQRVRGVTAIAEEITVRDTWGAADTDIAREAGEALQRSVDVPDTVRATVHGRVVTLSGVVEWQYQRAAAARAVRHLKGNAA